MPRASGATIPPNSDRFSLGAQFEPLTNLKLNTSFVFIRHANVNESLPDDAIKQYLSAVPEDNARTNGGVLDSPNSGNGVFDYTKNHLMFMEQGTKQYIFQVKLGGEWTLPPFRFGRIGILASYVFENIYNDGIDRDMFPTLGKGYDNVTATDIADARNQWKSGLHNTVNSYFQLGIRFTL
jgi:hypothetical protein